MQIRTCQVPGVALITLALAGGVFAQSQTPLENDQVRVVLVTDQPHAKTKPHDHKLNRVMIYLQPGSQEIHPLLGAPTAQEGKATTLKWKAGEVKWSPASGMHVSEVVSTTPVTIVEVEIKKDGDPGKAVKNALDPVKVDAQDYKVEFENSQVRVTRVRLAPHRMVPLHEHALNRVVVYLAEQKSRMTTSDGKTETSEHKPGEVSWGGPVKHSEENLLDKPFEAVAVELKN